MTHVDKKNTWWRINDGSAQIGEKTAEILRAVLSKFPTLETKTGYALIVSKEVKIYLSVNRCVGTGDRVLLRYSTDDRAWLAKSLKSCKPHTGEVRESQKYADGSSRIDLDYAFKQISSFIDIEAQKLDKAKKAQFNTQINQMKLVGRIKGLINDELYDVCAHPTSINHVSILGKDKKERLTISKNGEASFIAGFPMLGYMHVKDEVFNDFIKDVQGFLKYV